MKVLVIPDVHLKPEIFDVATRIMKNSDCNRAVCVGDIVDDWGCEKNTDLYEETLKKAIEFSHNYRDTLWCYGNHDLAYLWDQYTHPGFSTYAQEIVRKYFSLLNDTGNLAIMHRIDNTIFSHAGLTKEFVDYYLNDMRNDVDSMIDSINRFGKEVLWDDMSPLWARPQYHYANGDVVPSAYLHVVGHTPMKLITLQGNLLSVDVFSTWSDGRPYGNQEMCWVDTETREWRKINI